IPRRWRREPRDATLRSHASTTTPSPHPDHAPPTTAATTPPHQPTTTPRLPQRVTRDANATTPPTRHDAVGKAPPKSTPRADDRGRSRYAGPTTYAAPWPNADPATAPPPHALRTRPTIAR